MEKIWLVLLGFGVLIFIDNLARWYAGWEEKYKRKRPYDK